MNNSPTISLVVPPFPTFIEGNKTSYTVGKIHPSRKNLPYFDLIFVTSGALYLTEDNCEFTIKENEMFTLLPKRHHFSTHPCSEYTEFYWLHFYYDGVWEESFSPRSLSSTIPIPNLHYHNEDYTIQIKKQQLIADPEYLYALIEQLLQGTKEQTKSISFWENQERFLKIIKTLEEQSISKSPAIILAKEVELFIRNNYMNAITNQLLSEQFHFHINYIIRCMKQVYAVTPLEFLIQYRLEKGASLLLKTNLTVTEITNQIGFQSSAYFSLCFKKKFGSSPLSYRKAHTSIP